MIRKFFTAVFAIAFLVLFNSYTSACFNPTDSFAVEVVLNRADITYDVGRLQQAENVRNDDGIIVHLSHYNADVAVIVSKIDEPVIGLSVKLQIPTKTIEVERQTDLVPAVDIDKDKFDFPTAIKVELEWLRQNMIIAGITDADIKMITAKAKAGTAGWNSRIIYEEGNWLPYSETNLPLLLRDSGCGGFSLNNVPKGQIVLPGSTAVTKKGKLPVTWGRLKAVNGFL